MLQVAEHEYNNDMFGIAGILLQRVYVKNGQYSRVAYRAIRDRNLRSKYMR
jgi:hypothetical protein